MDNNIAYKITNQSGFILYCKCRSEYYYLSKHSNKNRYTSTYTTSKIMVYYIATCSKCFNTINIYSIDTIIEIGKIAWITV